MRLNRLKITEKMAIALLLVSTVSVVNGAQVDLLRYGNCSVVSYIDEFEDKMLLHLLACDGSSYEWVSVSCSESMNLISLKPSGTYFSHDEWIDIRYRFDRRNHVTGRWRWKNDKQTANYDAGDAERDNFLYRMKSANRLFFGIGNTRARIDFEDGMINAIDDFKGRCANFDTVARRNRQPNRGHDARIDVDAEGYIARIEQKIRSSWQRPSSVKTGLRCEIRISQIPGGEVVQTYIRTSSGNVDFDRSVEEAALRASPLPVPKNLTLFKRHIVITFDSED